MRTELLELLRCPRTRQRLVLERPEYRGEDIDAGWLVSENGQGRYPIRNSIPRFVPESNYADNFGMQWNKFRKTQLDSYSGHPISRERFFHYTGWSQAMLKDKYVLDVGCGAGRFTEVALACGANVVALDYSNAVDACRDNLAPHPRLEIVQGDIYSLPLRLGLFDFVYCLGVLQHTPNVEKAFLSLSPHLRRGGKLAVDLYPKLWMNLFWPKYWIRPFSKQVGAERLFKWVQIGVKYLLPVSYAVGKIPRIGRKLRYAVPIANYDGVYPLSSTQIREWAVLDTFDMFAPRYDSPQTAKTLREWFQRAGLEDIEVFRSGFLLGRGTKPSASPAGF